MIAPTTAGSAGPIGVSVTSCAVLCRRGVGTRRHAFSVQVGSTTSQQTRHARRLYVGGLVDVSENEIGDFFVDLIRGATLNPAALRESNRRRGAWRGVVWRGVAPSPLMLCLLARAGGHVGLPDTAPQRPARLVWRLAEVNLVANTLRHLPGVAWRGMVLLHRR
jgi:hypothetical protein